MPVDEVEVDVAVAAVTVVDVSVLDAVVVVTSDVEVVVALLVVEVAVCSSWSAKGNSCQPSLSIVSFELNDCTSFQVKPTVDICSNDAA